jgi:PAS domain S-box-containing protein
MRELEHLARRYANLYDFAPTGYVSFHRSGQIAEINLAAEALIGLPRDRLIGMPFAVFVYREDLALFLNHLLRCRHSDGRIETDLRLKNAARKLVPVQLCSTPLSASPNNGALLLQTSIIDLTERKNFEETIRRSEKRYRTLFDLVPVAIYACDAYGRIQDYNQRAVELWGTEPNSAHKEQRFCGSHKIYYPDGRPMPHEEYPIARVLRGEKPAPKNLEIVIERPNGERRHVIPAPSILTDERGEVTGAINCLFDITERKRAETSVMRLAAAVKSSHDAVAAKTLQGIITDWNQSAERIFGYKPKEIIGKSVLTLIPEDRQAEEEKILKTIGRGESLDHFETVRRRKDGKLIDVSLTISPIKGPKGEILGVSKIARDITKQKQTERRVAEQARLLDLTNDAVIVRDHRDRIVYWNRGAAEMYGFAAEEAVGKISHKLLRTEHPENLKSIRERLELDNRWSGELVHTRKDGKTMIVFSRWSLDRDASGRPASILESNTDITARKRAETALRASKALLEQRVRNRTSELRKVNKDLQGEIERRKGLEGEILSVSDREQQRLGQELHDGLCQHLTAVAFMTRSIALRLKNHRVVDAADIEKVAELVNRAAIDTRNLSSALHRLDVDAAGLVVALDDLVDREIWRTPCRLVVRPSFHIHDDAVATHLYRIAREGVINANKHARARQVVIRLERAQQEMVLRIIDDGVGISKNRTPQHGLGFHIMKYRAQLIGGRLEIDSPKRGGTCVSCYLPVAVAQSEKMQRGHNLRNRAAKLR